MATVTEREAKREEDTSLRWYDTGKYNLPILIVSGALLFGVCLYNDYFRVRSGTVEAIASTTDAITATIEELGD